MLTAQYLMCICYTRHIHLSLCRPLFLCVMARKPENNMDSLRLDFMLNASRAAFNICPQLAAYFGNEFLTSCNEDKTTPALLRQSCPSCGVPLVAGRSVSRISVARSDRSDTDAGNKKSRRTNSQSRHGTKQRSAILYGGSKRIIEVGADGNPSLARAQTSKYVRAVTHADHNGTIEYDCVLCKARIRFPSETKPSRETAGHKRKAETKDAYKQETLCSNSDTQTPEPLTTTAATIPSSIPKVSVGPKALHSSSHADISKPRKPNVITNAAAPSRASTPMSQPSTPNTTGVKSDKQPIAGTQPQIAKRKKNKSNLLAAVAANKKKAEAKKAAESGAFSLTDFLSNL